MKLLLILTTLSAFATAAMSDQIQESPNAFKVWAYKGNEDSDSLSTYYSVTTPNGTGYDYLSRVELDKYPHIFKPLQWWEERNMEDMPKYVRYIGEDDIYVIDRNAIFLTNWRFKNIDDGVRDGFYTQIETGYGIVGFHHSDFAPATLADYTAYQQTKNK